MHIHFGIPEAFSGLTHLFGNNANTLARRGYLEDPNEKLPAIVPAVLTVVVYGLVFLVLLPCANALDRVRANYTPKGVSLGDEDVFVGPRLTGVFSTLRRVKSLEGWFGVYRGVYALILTGAVVNILLLAVWGILSLIGGRVAVWAPLVVLPFAVVLSVPVVILVNRAIVTPYRTPSTPWGALRTLLTPYERSRPWVLFKIPGLLATLVLVSAWEMVLRVLVAPGVLPDNQNLRIALGVTLPIISTAWLVPLKVLVMKISVQENREYHAPPADDAEATADADVDTEAQRPDVAALEPLRIADEEVVALRPGPHYRGVFDAVRTIITEEGKGALYRGWGWTLLGNCLIAGGVVVFILNPAVPGTPA